MKCCFTSTETVGLLGTGAQGVHLDFHTAPELCTLGDHNAVKMNRMREKKKTKITRRLPQPLRTGVVPNHDEQEIRDTEAMKVPLKTNNTTARGGGRGGGELGEGRVRAR